MTTEPLHVAESVVAAEAPKGLAGLLHECKRHAFSYCVAQILELAVDGILAQGRRECLRVQKKVYVFGEPLNEIPAFGEARAAFEDELVAGDAGNGAQGLGDVVVLFDERGSQSLAAEVIRCPEDRLLEVGMLRQFHVVISSSRAMTWQSADR